MGKGKVVSKEVKVEKLSIKKEAEEGVVTKEEGRRPVRRLMPANGKNGIFAIEYRRKTVAEKYLLGWSQWEIAEACEVTQGTIMSDLDTLQSMWRERAIDDIEKRKYLELAKIDNLERMASDEYTISQGIEETKTVYEETSGEFTKDGRKVVTRGRLGDPRYLDKIQWCIEMRCKILGIIKDEKKGTQINILNIDWQAIMDGDTGADDINRQIVEIENVKTLPIIAENP